MCREIDSDGRYPVCDHMRLDLWKWDAQTIMQVIIMIIAVLLLLSITMAAALRRDGRGRVYDIAYITTLVGGNLMILDNLIWFLYEDACYCVPPYYMWFGWALGVPLSVIPVLLVEWRICCAYITTYSWNNSWKLERQSPMQIRTRGFKWFAVRFSMLMSIFVVVSIALFFHDSMVYVLLFLHLLYALMLAGVATRLFLLRDQLTKTQPSLVQHAMLTCAFAYFMTLYTVVSGIWTMYLYIRKTELSGLDFFFTLSKVACVLLAAGLWLHYNVVVRPNLLNDSTKEDTAQSSTVRGNMKVFLEDGSTIDFEQLAQNREQFVSSTSLTKWLGSDGASNSGMLQSPSRI